MTERDGVVLLHGIGRTSASMRKLEQALAAAGFSTMNLDYPSRRYDVADLAYQVAMRVERFTADPTGRIHFVTHSMGGLVARAAIHRHRPARLGRVVMLAPPNQGSEIADLLGGSRTYGRVFGPAGSQLGTHSVPAMADLLGSVDYELGIIAGTRALDPLGWAALPKPNDGKVSVAATKVEGMADHIVLPVTHTFIMRDPAAIAASMHFLRRGCFPK